MSDFADLFSQTSWAAMVPLYLIAALTAVLFIERSLTFRSIPGLGFFRSQKRLRAERHARLRGALDSYLALSSPEHEKTLLSECRANSTPASRLIRRYLREGPPPAELRRPQLAEAALLGELEIDRGLNLFSYFARAALFAGLLGALSGLTRSLRMSALSFPGDPEAWSAGLPAALGAAELGLVIALAGGAGGSWLLGKARSLRNEIRRMEIRLASEAPHREREAHA
jgi:biopolymer transport protein ExbB/TolQ